MGSSRNYSVPLRYMVVIYSSEYEHGLYGLVRVVDDNDEHRVYRTYNGFLDSSRYAFDVSPRTKKVSMPGVFKYVMIASVMCYIEEYNAFDPVNESSIDFDVSIRGQLGSTLVTTY